MAGDGSGSSFSALPLLDVGTLDALRRLSAGLLGRLSGTIARAVPPWLEKLDEAHRAGDAEATSFAAHRVKSSCAAVGAARLRAICEHIEQSAMAGDLGPARELSPLLHTTFAATLERLRAEALA